MIEPDPPEIEIQPVGRVPPRIYALIGLVAALLVVAVLKPWGSPVAQQTTPMATPDRGETRAAATQISHSSEEPVVPDVLEAARSRKLCGVEPQWRLLTMEVGTLGTSRTVYYAPPVAAKGPTDDTIPTIKVTAQQLLGIGICRSDQPDADVASMPVTGVTIWQISPPSSPSIIPGVTIDADMSRVGEAYFRPASTQPSFGNDHDPAVWAPGRYAVEVDDADGDGHSLWLALDFINIRATTGAVTDQ